MEWVEFKQSLQTASCFMRGHGYVWLWQSLRLPPPGRCKRVSAKGPRTSEAIRSEPDVGSKLMETSGLLCGSAQ